MVRRAALLLAAVCMLAARPADAPQEVRIRTGPYAFPQTTISVQANLVETGVRVQDRGGRAIAGLKQSDFAIFDNGKPQQISFFTATAVSAAAVRPAAQPAAAAHALAVIPVITVTPNRSLVLFLDDTHGNSYSIAKSIVAARKVTDAMRPTDRTALFTGSGTVTADFTADREKLGAALDHIKLHPARHELDSCVTMDPYQAYAIDQHIDYAETQRAIAKAIACNCPSGDPECIKEQPAYVQDAASTSWSIYRAGSESVLDVLRVAVNGLAKMPGNRILVMLSPGFVTGDMDREKSAIFDSALRAGIVISGINTAGLTTAFGAMMRQSVLSDVMAGAANATGGSFVKNSNAIEGAAETLSEPAADSYRIGFVPSAEPDDRYHKLRVRVVDTRAAEVGARPGYWAEKVRTENAQRRIDDAILAGSEVHEIPARLRVTLTGSRIAVRFIVNPQDLRFLKKSGREYQELTFVAVLENAGGEYLTGRQSVMDLALTPERFAAMQQTGLNALMNFTAPPGKYALRTVVREAAGNRIAAATARFEIR